MKSDKNSKKNIKNSDIEKNDLRSQFGKSVKKDRSGKKRLSIYDEFDDDLDTMNYKRDDLYEDEEDDEN
jgi:hypothetical protein